MKRKHIQGMHYSGLILATLIVLVLITIGARLIFSHAATPYATVEAETGTIASCATKVATTLASDDSEITFKCAGVTPTPNTTYYISATGSDSNSGTSASSPWKTITHANTVSFKAGNAILFQGGTTFSGQLYFSSGESGTSTNPIIIGSYGTGSATISGGSGNAIYAYDTAGFYITNLVFTGAGAGNNSGAGINFYNGDSGNTILNYVYVNNVSASGFQNGFYMGGGNGGSGFSNVTVTNSTFDNNQLAGLATYGPTFNTTSPTYVNQTLKIGYVTAYDNAGNSNLTGSNDSGNGIVLSSTENSTIYNSAAYSNGADCRANACGVGIWAYNSYDDVIKNNQSYNNLTGGVSDGDGFDFDQNTSDSTMEYNYSHNNDGAGYLLFGESDNTAHKDNTVRFNISQDDGRKNNYGAIYTYGPISGDSIYNNTVYLSAGSSGDAPVGFIAYDIDGGNTVRNNIFDSASGIYSVVVSPATSTADLDLQGNDYYPMKIYWGSTIYTALASWRSATGQEEIGGTATGNGVNPELVDAGGGGTIGTSNSLLTQYKLASGSPMTNTGINLTTKFGTSIGTTDFYGIAVPGTSGLSVGAAE